MNSKITFNELVDRLAQASGTQRRVCELYLKEFFATIAQTLIEKESVAINGLGEFKVGFAAPRRSVDVNTGKEIEIAGHHRISFEPDKLLAAEINAPFADFETIELDSELTQESLDAIDDEPIMAVVQNNETIEVSEPEAEPGTEEPTDNNIETTPDTTEETTEESTEEPTVSEEPLITPPPFVLPVKNAVTPTITPTEPIAEQPIENNEETVAKEEPVEETTTEQPIVPQENKSFVIPKDESETTDEYSYYYDDDDESWIQRHQLLVGMLLGFVAAIAIGVIVFVTFKNDITPLLVPEVKTEIVSDDSAVNDSIAIEEESTELVENAVPEKPAVVYDTVKISLSKIAKKHYGNSEFWVYVYEENKNKIPNPNNVAPGTVVVVPPAEKYGIDASNSESLSKARTKASQILSQQ